MILLLRIFPHAIVLLNAAAFFFVLKQREYVYVVPALALAISALLLARLVRFSFRSSESWVLVFLPLMFAAGGYGVMLFFESIVSGAIAAVFVCLFLFFFLEHVFAFHYAPARYQAYALEHASTLLGIASVFFFSAIGFGLRLLLQIPASILASGFFVITACLFYSIFWMAKAPAKQARWYGGLSALLATEGFLALLFLPTGFYTNAAILSVLVYLLLGVMRARLLDTLQARILRQYLLASGVFLLLLFFTATWF